MRCPVCLSWLLNCTSALSVQFLLELFVFFSEEGKENLKLSVLLLSSTLLFLGRLSLAFFCVVVSWGVTYFVISSLCSPKRGRADCHFYLFVAFPLQVWSFSHPPVSLHGHSHKQCYPRWDCLSSCMAGELTFIASLSTLITDWLCSTVSPRDPSYSCTPLGLPFSFPELIPLRMVLLHGDLIESEMLNCNLVFSFFLQWSAGECCHTCFLFIVYDVAGLSWVLGFAA